MPFPLTPVAIAKSRPVPSLDDIPDVPVWPPVDAPRAIAYRNGFMFSLGNLDRRAAMFCKKICRGVERFIRGSYVSQEAFRCREALLGARVISPEEFGGENSKLLARAMVNIYHEKYGEEFASSPATASDAHYLASRAAATAAVEALRCVERPGLTPNSHSRAWLEFNLRSLSTPPVRR